MIGSFYHEEIRLAKKDAELRREVKELGWLIGHSAYWGWPLGFTEEAHVLLGPQVYNSASPRFKGLHKRISHAIDCWEQRYGALTPKQELYVETLLVYACKEVRRTAATQGDRYRFLCNAIAKLVNHERVHAGFLRRAAESTADYGDLLKRVPR